MRESADVLSWIGVTASGHTLNNLRYADDIVLIATTPTALQQLKIELTLCHVIMDLKSAHGKLKWW